MCNAHHHAGGPARAYTRRSVLAGLTSTTALALAGCSGEGTGLGLNLVSPAQAREAGLEAWSQIRRQTQESDNATYQATARKVSADLLGAVGENPGEWEVVVFEGDEVNAFALPGKKIGVFEGLFRYAQSEDQLAAVIGHEIAHNAQNHAAQRLSDAAATQIGAQLLGLALGGGDPAAASQMAALLGAGAQYGIILPYARNQELEADRLGLFTMARAGYDPRQAIALWRNMETAGGSRPPAFLSTHPGTEDRVAQLERLMPEALRIYRA